LTDEDAASKQAIENSELKLYNIPVFYQDKEKRASFFGVVSNIRTVDVRVYVTLDVNDTAFNKMKSENLKVAHFTYKLLKATHEGNIIDYIDFIFLMEA
jgi:hypothetical protein